MDKPFRDVDAKVYLSYKCEGNCPFCLTEVRPKTDEVQLVEYGANFFKEIYRYYEGGGRKVLFTGGEPTDVIDKLLGMLQILRMFSFELVVLYTNGVKLLNEIKYQGERGTILNFLSQAGLRKLNMSVHHYNANKRKELSEHVGKAQTETIISKIKENGLDLRLNCTLQKDFIGNLEEIKKYLHWANSLGVKDVYFRDLFHIDNRTKKTTPGDQKKLEYTDQQRIDFTKLIGELMMDDEFVFDQKLSRHKDWGQTIIFTHQTTGINVSLGTLTIGSERNEVTYFTINPNGKMTSNMNQSKYTV